MDADGLQSLTDYQLLHGVNAPLPETIDVRAGSLEGVLDGIDLRYVRVGALEVVRRVYMAVRDENWNTIPAQYTMTHCQYGHDSFEVEFDAEHRSGELDFVWKGRISGSPGGELVYRMDGEARSAFRFNRIGLCVLHPSELAGNAFRAQTPSRPIAGHLPDLIGPQSIVNGKLQPIFPSFSSLSIDAGGAEIRCDFEGDLFEMEDQRNWTDASFKTYSTPLALGFPHDATPGQRISQRLTISVAAESHEPTVERPRITLTGRSPRSLPSIGFGLPERQDLPTPQEVERLRRLRPDHLRVDLYADRFSLQEVERVSDLCASVGCPAEVAVFVSTDDAEEMELLAEVLKESGIRIARFLVFDRNARSSQPSATTSAALLEMARRSLLPAAPGAILAGGTNMNFCELNRTRPSADALDAVSYSINPQVHASDDLSVAETPLAQTATVRTAQSFSGGRPVIVSPITLKPRFNPNATTAEEAQVDPLPPSVDLRQMSLFGAAWTVASLAALSAADAASLTYYETAGWRGLMQGDSGSPMPELFPSLPRAVYPLYHVFADAAEWKGKNLIACDIGSPLTVAALGVEDNTSVHLLVANLTGASQTVVLEPLGVSSARARTLDVTTARTAMLEPERFRRERESLNVDDGQVVLTLGPYATALVDATHE